MKRLIFFGAGNISQAVISGLVNSGLSKVRVEEEKLAPLKEFASWLYHRES